MISVERVAPHGREALENLFQFYLYDWSELRGAEGAAAPPDSFASVGEDGRYAKYPLDPYFGDPDKHPFVFRVDGKLAGFALVAKRALLVGGIGLDMAEYFVMRRYRRTGLGMTAAHTLFDRFPGEWEVRQRSGNRIATAFWRRAIGEFTNGRFEETTFDDDRWRGPVQTFFAGR